MRTENLVLKLHMKITNTPQTLNFLRSHHAKLYMYSVKYYLAPLRKHVLSLETYNRVENITPSFFGLEKFIILKFSRAREH